MRVIDLSLPVMQNDSEPIKVSIVKTGYKEGAEKMCEESAKLILKPRHILTPEAFPESMFISNEQVCMGTHSGTHVDAPAHFGPVCEGEEARTIDQCPLDWFFGKGLVLHFKGKLPNEEVTKQEVIDRLAHLKYSLRPGDILLLNTGTYQKWGSKAYFSEAPGVSVEATEYILDQGVKLIGTDTYGYDHPFPVMLKGFAQTGDTKKLWPNHMLGRRREYVHMERLTNLDALDPPSGFWFFGFPIKMKGADASWIRAVAIYPE